MNAIKVSHKMSCNDGMLVKGENFKVWEWDIFAVLNAIT